MIKKIFAIALLGGSVTVAVLILKGDSPKNKMDLNLALEKNQSAEQPTRNPAPSLLKNSTSQIANDIAQELINKNPDGPISIENQNHLKAVDPEEIVSQIFEDQLNNIDLSEFTPQVSLNDFKIVENSEKEIMENYFKNVNAILINNFSNLSANLAEPSVKDFKIVSSSYEKTISEFYKLVVPQPLAQIHLEQVRLMIMQRSAFDALANYENDSLKSLIAIEVLQQVDGLSLELKAKMVNFIAEHSLNI